MAKPEDSALSAVGPGRVAGPPRASGVALMADPEAAPARWRGLDHDGVVMSMQAVPARPRTWSLGHRDAAAQPADPATTRLSALIREPVDTGSFLADELDTLLTTTQDSARTRARLRET